MVSESDINLGSFYNRNYNALIATFYDLIIPFIALTLVR